MDETSQPIEVLLSVSRDDRRGLGTQIEAQLRGAIREGRLRAGARVPSTRDLARQLGVSRRVVVGAYEQLAAEGYLTLRQGARPCVAETARARVFPTPAASAPAAAPRFDLRPRAPDVSAFPRSEWLRCLRDALQAMTNAELGYGDPRGVEALRSALADYLGRVRGVVAAPERVVITNGYSQGQGIICRVLAARGARRIGFENPSHPDQRRIAERAGLEIVPIATDDAGIRVDQLDRAAVDALVLTPAHQHPTGAVLTGERRRGLLTWLRQRDAIVIEDDYDAEYRYDRAAVGALQGLEPDRIVYAGSASKTLAPALRLGWLVVPARLLAAVTDEKDLADCGTARIEQHAFATFLARGELDRHLRRMRARYRRRRDLLLDELAHALPEATVRGIAAGLHATVELPGDHDERAILDQARRRGINLMTTYDFWIPPGTGAPTLLLGYAQIPVPAIPTAIRALADAVRSTRER
ncbi:PLP-dependent aminotransferase family protein [Nonomuraea jiangxiensis]|uniref:GntR family transcriptional regulator / MocR family aminotransferase n=1 Tax=Nonomuraea jiangxiensis TaxID=633440 RepID=A0A1G8QSU3_9ACTN|nr:PLP-dependent aminotransferase family protein [Nonomuraea jiangxiensis]SDJ07758.1 GntR family transcriptional regulator / MocR family aminotransferase [Nonomuraea jiangxiensis]